MANSLLDHSIQQMPDFRRQRPATPNLLKLFFQHLSLQHLATIGDAEAEGSLGEGGVGGASQAEYPAFPQNAREGRGEVSTVACDPAGLGEFTARGGSFEIALEGIRDGRSGRAEYRGAERHRLERVEHREHEGQGEQGVHRRFSYGLGLNGAGPS